MVPANQFGFCLRPRGLDHGSRKLGVSTIKTGFVVMLNTIIRGCTLTTQAWKIHSNMLKAGCVDTFSLINSLRPSDEYMR